MDKFIVLSDEEKREVFQEAAKRQSLVDDIAMPEAADIEFETTKLKIPFFCNLKF
ncbi:MAG: hypothetical protein WC748_08190 [Legionellales bacterium]|jgi:hypothetical protein